jgi:hypothetical protein
MPNTIAEGCCGIPSTMSSSGVAFSTPGSLAIRRASESGRSDDVGSATPFWKMPRSASPRWMRSPALRFSPAVTDSSATIVATPSAMPVAVSTVRAGRLIRLDPMTASTTGERSTRVRSRRDSV